MPFDSEARHALPARQRLAVLRKAPSQTRREHLSRRYTQAELQAILAKALEEEDSEPHDGIDGYSLSEIKDIGAEVGIDASRVERAASSLAPATGGPGSGWLGAPTSLSVRRRVDGELASVPTSELLSAIRRGMGSAGEFSDTNGLLEWRSTGAELGQRLITLSSNDGVTAVEGMADLKEAAVVIHAPAVLVGLIGSILGFIFAANSGSGIGLLAVAALVPVLLFGTRRFFSRVSGSQLRKLEGVVEELAALIRGSN